MKSCAIAVTEDFADVQQGGARMLALVMLAMSMFYVTLAVVIMI